MNVDLALRLAFGVSPLVLLLLGAVRGDRSPSETDVFARQPWTVGDAATVLAIVVGSTWLPAIPGLHNVPQLQLFVIVATVQALVVLGAVYCLLRARHRLSAGALGIRTRYAGYYLFWALKMEATIIFVFTGARVLLAWMSTTGLDFAMDPGSPKAGSMVATIADEGLLSFLMWLLVALHLAVVGPIVEEVVFRGVLGAPLARKYGLRGAAILSSSVWALGHTSHIGGALLTFVAGVIFMFLYKRSQSLLPCICLHGIGNMAVFLIRDVLRSFEQPATFLVPGLALIGLVAVVSSVATRRARPSSRADLLPWS